VAGRIGPEYQRLMDQLRSKITSGEYPVGSMIPSTTELKNTTGMSIPVIRRAVGQLEADGILEGHPGKGVYVKATPAAVASERQDIKTLGEQVAALHRQVRELAERAAGAQPADFADDLAELRDTVGDMRSAVGRIEANLIDLYGKTGHAYPQGGTHDGAKATARRGRSRR
jgi:DNA-binding GntR family transcriptional regulator